MMEVLTIVMDLALGGMAYRLARSLDTTVKALAERSEQQAEILKSLADRVTRLEGKSDGG